MKLTIVTTITNPVQRQDMFLEAFQNYCSLADEVIVVNGGKPLDIPPIPELKKLRVLDLPWEEDWHWLELPRHLNLGRQFATGDWILRLDIDQFIHEKDFALLRRKIALCPKDCDVISMQKISYTHSKSYFQKGSTNILMRNKHGLNFGKLIGEETDLCFPVNQTDVETIKWNDMVYVLPVGTKPRIFKSGVQYHNYDYFFRDLETTKKEFWKNARAYGRYFEDWKFGSTPEESFEKFSVMISERFAGSKLRWAKDQHPVHIRQKILDVPEDRLGHHGWGILNGK